MADDILSQDEIEALLTTIGQDDESQDAVNTAVENTPSVVARRSAAPTIAYEVYDFRRPDKLSKEQLRTLQMLHETFARLSGTGLSAFFRSPVTLELISLEQVPYEEYLRGMNQSVFVITSLSPLTGQAVFEMEFEVLYAMIDRLLGGPGRAIERSVFTDIERPLIRQTFERIFSAFKTAWENVVIVSPGIEGMESSSQFVQIAPPNDIVVTILFEVKIGDVRGAMSICIPYLVLKPISAKLSAQKWFVSGNRKQSPANRRAITGQIASTPVNCSIRLGEMDMNVHEFLRLKPGDVIRLNQSAKGNLPMFVSATPKFKGKPATSGKKLAFHISELIEY